MHFCLSKFQLSVGYHWNEQMANEKLYIQNLDNQYIEVCVGLRLHREEDKNV
jgi:hypothetical protein